MKTRSEFYTGIVDILPLALGVAVYGAAFGLLAAQAQMSEFHTALMGIFVFAGASQIIAVERLVAEAGAFAAITAGIALNLRMLLMTATLRNDLKGRSLWQICLGVHLTTDENWALMYAKRAKGIAVGYWYLVGGGTALGVVWILSTVAGVSFASFLPQPETIGVDFAFTAAFIAILCSLWTGKTDALPWMISVVTAVILAIYAPIETSWALVAGGLCGALGAGLIARGPQQKNQEVEAGL